VGILRYVTPTQETQSAEQTLDQIATACLMALDPALTREQLVRRVKDIFRMATPRGDGMDLDDEDNE
jgi:hypothetical protein